MAEKKIKIIAENRKARHDFTIHETYEAGIELTGIPLFASFPFPWEEDRKDVSIKLLKRNQFLRLL